MFELNNIIRPNIKNLKPYSSARDEYKGKQGIFLDANENPFGRLNRYPDPHHKLLREKLGRIKSLDPSSIFIGNGSDEIIDLVFRIFCSPGKDKALTFMPTYGMYEVAASVNDVELISSELDENFQIDPEDLKAKINDPDLKLIIACSPNNPTGNIIYNIDKVAGNFPGIVLVDEAYIDFSGRGSLVNLIDKIPNLIVCQTFSKAFGLAGARIGVAYANAGIIDLLYKVKPPYNVSKPDQDAAIAALDDIGQTQKTIEKIIEERKYLEKELGKNSLVRKIWPSDANFILIRVDNAEEIYSKLISENIIVRKRSRQVPGALRITVGSPAENIKLLTTMKKIEGGACTSFKIDHASDPVRYARSVRSTSETAVIASVNLDGNGFSMINTGIGFFDHMLLQLSRHGGFDLEVSVTGDLEVDQHHTIEDVALTIGEAFDKALGSRTGIERYGFMLPMDDALAQVAVDFGGRSYLVWDVEFRREAIGEMPTEMMEHFFRSFAEKARCNLNIKAEGVNEHHKAEAIFKAFARAARMAVKLNGHNRVPSTKGVI